MTWKTAKTILTLIIIVGFPTILFFATMAIIFATTFAGFFYFLGFAIVGLAISKIYSYIYFLHYIPDLQRAAKSEDKKAKIELKRQIKQFGEED